MKVIATMSLAAALALLSATGIAVSSPIDATPCAETDDQAVHTPSKMVYPNKEACEAENGSGHFPYWEDNDCRILGYCMCLDDGAIGCVC
ncbi:hypothetical protein EV182_001331 [Spiromyces aspiralis]|uniref:Uncharacterized protein n=1 Tax=Spiromyces aspiralis TaxID=68401 RepID=A0ACC1HT98_9FUNG|nr:hypothetical protein EV182_001331 [Spiromyces aspiralis]